MTTASKTHKEVKAFYAEYARTGSSCCGPENNLYPAPLLQGLPSDITSFTAGSGNPITTAKLKPGETVLDLGSGGGLDCFLAAHEVTESGHVIGVDMTPQMLNRAGMAAKRLGLKHVEFREGYLEALPVDDNSVDVVISNCVINLSPDKPQVLREIFRVLKPGGRISISDIVTNKPVPEEKLKESEEWCGCISGALPIQVYTEELLQAGFVDITLRPDLEIARQAIEQGQCQSAPGVTKEDALKNLDNWETSDRNVFMPHMITARKPG